MGLLPIGRIAARHNSRRCRTSSVVRHHRREFSSNNGDEEIASKSQTRRRTTGPNVVSVRPRLQAKRPKMKGSTRARRRRPCSSSSSSCSGRTSGNRVAGAAAATGDLRRGRGEARKPGGRGVLRGRRSEAAGTPLAAEGRGTTGGLGLGSEMISGSGGGTGAVPQPEPAREGRGAARGVFSASCEVAVAYARNRRP
jgi:hypothetical protein